MATRNNALDQKGVLHFVTLNVRERRKAFSRAPLAQIALRELRYECDRHPALLVGYVAMPDHLHFLLDLEDGALSRFLARYKPAVTKKVATFCEDANWVRASDWIWEKGRRELWQDSKYSSHLWSEKFISQKLRYIHQNPVRSGLVENEADYPWSSIAAYLPDSQFSPPVPVDLQGCGKLCRNE